MEITSILACRRGRDGMADFVCTGIGTASTGCPPRDSCKLLRRQFFARTGPAVSLNPEHLIILAEIRKAQHGVLLHFEEFCSKNAMQGNAPLSPVLRMLFSGQQGVFMKIQVMPNQAA